MDLSYRHTHPLTKQLRVWKFVLPISLYSCKVMYADVIDDSNVSFTKDWGGGQQQKERKKNLNVD